MSLIIATIANRPCDLRMHGHDCEYLPSAFCLLATVMESKRLATTVPSVGLAYHTIALAQDPATVATCNPSCKQLSTRNSRPSKSASARPSEYIKTRRAPERGRGRLTLHR